MEDYQKHFTFAKKLYRYIENNDKLRELDKDLVYRFGYNADFIDFDRLVNKEFGNKKKLSEKLGRNLSLSF